MDPPVSLIFLKRIVQKKASQACCTNPANESHYFWLIDTSDWYIIWQIHKKFYLIQNMWYKIWKSYCHNFPYLNSCIINWRIPDKHCWLRDIQLFLCFETKTKSVLSALQHKGNALAFKDIVLSGRCWISCTFPQNRMHVLISQIFSFHINYWTQMS